MSARGERRAVLILLIDWAIFSGDKFLADIAIDYDSHPSDSEVGTEIEILGLNEVWTKIRLRRLYLELRRLISPLETVDNSNFKIFPDVSAYTRVIAGLDCCLNGHSEWQSCPTLT